MATFMLYYWLLGVIFFGAYITSWLFKMRSLKHFLDEKGVLIFIVLASLAFISIATNDPVTIAGVTIPTELQWFGSLLLTGFGSWKFYLNPLKNKVFSMDREIGEVKESVKNLETNMTTLTNHILSKKKN